MITLPALALAALLPAAPQRVVDVCFVLDTTGSMSSLIETAKEKIWFIAGEIVNAPSRPRVRFCLLGYRDRGDEYVTRHFDLTDDLDLIHRELMAFTADGGGDTPEAVNQALLEAVDSSDWSDDPGTLSLIFLVGDAPPNVYPDEMQYPQIAQRAAERGILINPVLVGGNTEARTAWQTIAANSGGRESRIEAGAAQEAISTPMDQDLAVLGPRLARLGIPYGPEDQQQAFSETIERTESLSKAAASDRLDYLSKAGGLTGRIDLIDALDRDALSLQDLDPDWLPESVRSMTTEELEHHLLTVRSERDEIRRIIHALVDERRAFIAERREGSGFESVVAELIVEQLGGN